MFIVEIILSLALGGVMVQSQFTAKANSLLGLQTGAQPLDWGNWLSPCTQHLLDNIYDNCVSFWLPQYKTDSDQLEQV